MDQKIQMKKDIEDYILNNHEKIMEALSKDLKIPINNLYDSFVNNKDCQELILHIIEKVMFKKINDYDKELN